MEQRVLTVEGEKKALNVSFVNAEDERDQIKSNYNRIFGQLGQLQTTNSLNIQDIESLRGTIRELDAESADLKEENQNLQNGIGSLRRECDALNNTIDE